MDSQNVKDELSYAIDEGMTIIPVLHQLCGAPLRVRRLGWLSIVLLAAAALGVGALLLSYWSSQPETESAQRCTCSPQRNELPRIP